MVAAQTAPSATEALQEQPVEDISLRDTLIPLIPTFEQRIFIVAILLLALIAGNIWSLLRSKNIALKPLVDSEWFSPGPLGIKVHHKDPDHRSHSTSQTGKTNFFQRIPFRKLYLFNFSLMVMIIGIISATVLMRPYVIETTPLQREYLSDAAQSITFEFDIPIKRDEIDLHISPETAGTWSFDESGGPIRVTRTVTFQPKESFYPGSEVVVYVVGIESFTGFGGSHEHSLEFKAPKIPALTSISPQNDSVDVSSDTQISLTYDAPVGDFIDTTVEITPPTNYNLTTAGSAEIISFPDGLEQDSTYTVTVFHTPQSFDVETGKITTRGETTLITETTFSTVSTPFVSEHSPKGKGILPEDAIEVTFDQEMNRESVEKHFTITPHIDGTFLWIDNTSFTYTPVELLPKDTRFTITFKTGMLSLLAGTIPEDITLKFTTIGPVTVTSTSPVSGTYGHDPAGTNISVTFDQEVDHASAQEHFSINPGVAGTFGWNENTLTYATAGNLSYATKYIVTVSSGVTSIHGLPSASSSSFSFTTRDQIFSLNVPWYKQQENFTCNIAAMRMVLAYRGVYLSEAQIKSMLGIGDNPNSNWVPGYGVHWGPAASLIGNYRTVAVKQGWTLEEILTEVEKGNPVVLWWYNRYSQPPGSFTLDSGATGWMGMHSEVVRGYIGSKSNPTSILTNDPWRGQLTYSKSLFMSTWGYIGYTAVVVK